MIVQPAIQEIILIVATEEMLLLVGVVGRRALLASEQLTTSNGKTRQTFSYSQISLTAIQDFQIIEMELTAHVT